MALSKKLPKQWRKSLSSKYPFLKLLLNKKDNNNKIIKNKNKYTEYHGISLPFKSHVYSKHGSPTFSLVCVMELVLYLYVLVKAKFFLKTITRQTFLKFNVSMKTITELHVFLTELILCLKKRSCYSARLYQYVSFAAK